MSETRATTAPVFPPGRYGHRRSGRRRGLLPIIALVLIIGVSAVLSVRLYQQFGETDYEAQIIGWQSNPPADSLTIEFRVHVPAGGAAQCMLRARDYQGFELGRRMVVIRAAGEATRIDAKEAVPTTARASVGDVMGCRPAE